MERQVPGADPLDGIPKNGRNQDPLALQVEHVFRQEGPRPRHAPVEPKALAAWPQVFDPGQVRVVGYSQVLVRRRSRDQVQAGMKSAAGRPARAYTEP